MAQGLSPGAIPDPEPKPPQEEEWQQNLNVRLICRDCREDPPELREDHASGDLICENCGLVLQQRSIDTSSEWRTFSNDDQGNDDPSRVGDGPNALLNGAQLNTNIAFGDGGMRSKELHRAQNKANHDKSNKLLLQAYKQIGALCDGWALPYTVSESAKHIYKDADESRLFKGKSQEALIAGCVFIACRRNNVPRTFREAMELTSVSKKEIGRTFKLLENFLMNKDKGKNAGSDAAANGKSMVSFSFTVSLILNTLLKRCGRLQRSLQGQRHCRPRRSLSAFLQHAGPRSARYQRRHCSGHRHDQEWRSGWSFASLVGRRLHLHGFLPNG